MQSPEICYSKQTSSQCYLAGLAGSSKSVHLMVWKQIKWRPQLVKINYSTCNSWYCSGLRAIDFLNCLCYYLCGSCFHVVTDICAVCIAPLIWFVYKCGRWQSLQTWGMLHQLRCMQQQPGFHQKGHMVDSNSKHTKVENEWDFDSIQVPTFVHFTRKGQPSSNSKGSGRNDKKVKIVISMLKAKTRNKAQWSKSNSPVQYQCFSLYGAW